LLAVQDLVVHQVVGFLHALQLQQEVIGWATSVKCKRR
jgi:hypothetical protein